MNHHDASSDAWRSLTSDALFLSRLKLLIIMAKAIERQYPLGRWRRKAVIENADFIFYETLFRTTALRSQANPKPTGLPAGMAQDGDESQILWLQRIQLLAVMTNAMAQGNPMGEFRIKALRENLSAINAKLDEAVELSQAPFLKVA